MIVIRICNWDEYQARNDKSLPWCKLHRKMLRSEIMALPEATRWVAVGLMMMAIENTPGEIHAPSVSWLQWRLNLESEPDLESLQAVEFIEVEDLSDNERTKLDKVRPRARARASTSTSTSTSYSESEIDTAGRVIALLNEKTGRSFPLKSPKGGITANAQSIVARLRDGWTETQLRAVVIRRWRRWKDDPKMSDYLQPSTLFRKSNFERYVSEVGA